MDFRRTGQKLSLIEISTQQNTNNIPRQSTERSSEESVTDVKGIFERTHPPVGMLDTICWSRSKTSKGIQNARPIRGTGNVFDDSEILKVSTYIQKSQLNCTSRSCTVYTSENKKKVLQQQGARGCPSGVSGMLILDHGKSVDLLKMSQTNLGNDNTVATELNNAGLVVEATKVNTLNEMRKALDINGSAIVGVSMPEIGGHYIIVDAIDEEGVRIRDPYHGWEVTVKIKSFLKTRSFPSTILQVKEN